MSDSNRHPRALRTAHPASFNPELAKAYQSHEWAQIMEGRKQHAERQAKRNAARAERRQGN